MADSITITEEETGPDAPSVEDNQAARPDWLPEKFNSPEDLAKSYTELEKKLSAPKDETSNNDDIGIDNALIRSSFLHNVVKYTNIALSIPNHTIA